MGSALLLKNERHYALACPHPRAAGRHAVSFSQQLGKLKQPLNF
jgi:hypothetical protein